MISCPNGGPSGHAYCEALGCDFCVAVVTMWADIDFTCDGIREVGRAGGQEDRRAKNTTGPLRLVNVKVDEA